MKLLTRDQKAVYSYIQSKMPEWVSPTRIGLDIGGRTSGGLQRHSAWASPICKKLVMLDIIQRNDKGEYATKSQEDICLGCPDYTSRCRKEPCGICVGFLKRIKESNYQPPLYKGETVKSDVTQRLL